MAAHITRNSTGNVTLDLRAMRLKTPAFSITIGLSLTSTSTGAITAGVDVYATNDPGILSTASNAGFANCAKDKLNAGSPIAMSGTGSGTAGVNLQTQSLSGLVPWDFISVNVTSMTSTAVQVDAWVRA